jgi:hypothetical protein
MMIRRTLPALCVLLSGCGALFNGSQAKVAFNSDPTGAQVWIDGTMRGTTPTLLSLAKNKSYTITFKKDGFEDASTEITRKVLGGYVVLDVLGGILPVVVDAATGSWYSLGTESVSMNLRDTATSLHGQLTPQQLAKVKQGVPLDRILDANEVSARMR